MCLICQKAAKERAELRGAMCPGEWVEELQGPGAGSPGAEASRAGIEVGDGAGQDGGSCPRALHAAFHPTPLSPLGSRVFGWTLPVRAEEPMEGCGGFPPASSVCWTCRWIFLLSETPRVTQGGSSPHRAVGAASSP